MICDAYSGHCVPTPTATIGVPTSIPAGATPPGPGTLPVTGGELVLMVALALAAIIAGLLFIVSGTRRQN